MDLTKTARGQPCHVRFPGACLGTTDTTVLAHLRLANLGGIAVKPPDVAGTFACRACHDIIDGRKPMPAHIEPDFHTFILEALLRTLDYWWSRGFLRECTPP